MSALSRPLLLWLYNVLQPEYSDVPRTYQDTAVVLQAFPSLRARTKIYTFSNGTDRLLLNLHGTVPSFFNAVSYKIPVEIWLPTDYPLSPPTVYVVPSSDMIIQPSNYIDNNGKFYNPYLSNWSSNSQTHTQNSSLLQLCNILSTCFSKQPPLYSKPKSLNTPNNHYQNHTSPPATPVKPPRPTSIPSLTSLVSSNLNSPPPPLPRKPTSNPALPPKPSSIHLNAQKQKILKNIQTSLVNLIKSDFDPFVTIADSQLLKLKNAISQLENLYKYENDSLVYYKESISTNEKILNEKTLEAQNVINTADTLPDPNVEEIICAETVLFNQLYHLVSDDTAISDTLYALNKAYDSGKISFDSFLKYSRNLSRDQFFKRALINKIVNLSGLDDSTDY
ncbi:ubiquitin-binding ESCRT-I subunit protein STP22 [Ascoidea rubescens DSM 1968]|uniref:UEV-domain-containing protein n=1 Tax=Ascoidea rubescens DSM 1968 TaxID=1344418 RepID=A0A1D2VQQ3_9ASCO|nr:UEV-domain-containing protein [Ascoidea rubescens DSM 1968]ODV63929.1 UEV-domain-containing protein [Ascoidea rubescens DSM 1968]